jgi:hypothetical protein
VADGGVDATRARSPPGLRSMEATATPTPTPPSESDEKKIKNDAILGNPYIFNLMFFFPVKVNTNTVWGGAFT